MAETRLSTAEQGAYGIGGVGIGRRHTTTPTGCLSSIGRAAAASSRQALDRAWHGVGVAVMAESYECLARVERGRDTQATETALLSRANVRVSFGRLS